jgi:hypothetical protein
MKILIVSFLALTVFIAASCAKKEETPPVPEIQNADKFIGLYSGKGTSSNGVSSTDYNMSVTTTKVSATEISLALPPRAFGSPRPNIKASVKNTTDCELSSQALGDDQLLSGTGKISNDSFYYTIKVKINSSTPFEQTETFKGKKQ